MVGGIITRGIGSLDGIKYLITGGLISSGIEISASKCGASGVYQSIAGAGRAGVSRVRNDIAGYYVIVAHDEWPNPYGDGFLFQTLPITLTLTLPPSGLRTHNILVLNQDEYRLKSRNQKPYSITIDSAGVMYLPPLSTPTGLTLRPSVGMRINVMARYPDYFTDLFKADGWRIWVDTVAPDVDLDTPTASQALTGDVLSAVVGPFSAGEWQVAVVLYRDSDSSQSPPLRGSITLVAPPDDVDPVHSGFDL